MIAIVKTVFNGRATAIVRRGHREETLSGLSKFDVTTLRPGDRIEVVRQVNNPYLIVIGKENKS